MERRSENRIDPMDIQCVICKLFFKQYGDRSALCHVCVHTNLERQCNLCERIYKITDHKLSRGPLWYCPLNADKIQDRCPYCITCSKYICRCCGISYIDKTIIDNEPSCMYKCRECNTLSYSIVESGRRQLPRVPGGFKNDYKLTITYDLHIETHDGYCSDPYDEQEIDREAVCDYPLMNMITDDHITKFMENQYSTDINPINYYILTGGPCGAGGSGYCGMGTTFKVKDIKIMKGELNYRTPDSYY